MRSQPYLNDPRKKSKSLHRRYLPELWQILNQSMTSGQTKQRDNKMSTRQNRDGCNGNGKSSNGNRCLLNSKLNEISRGNKDSKLNSNGWHRKP